MSRTSGPRMKSIRNQLTAAAAAVSWFRIDFMRGPEVLDMRGPLVCLAVTGAGTEPALRA